MSLEGARLPARWCPHGGDVNLVCGSCAEREKARPDSAGCGEREVPGRATPGGTEYRCGARWRTDS